MTSPTRTVQQLLGRAAERELVPADPRSSVRWHQHDYPGPFCRWNYHPELEIHLIRYGTGRFIVGDKIGTFGPGQLVLVGPNLPHDWISDLEPGQTCHGRDVVLQFDADWLQRCQHVLPELDALHGLIADASRGIEFFGSTAREAAGHLEKVGTTEGPQRVAHLFSLFAALLSAPPRERRTLADQWFHPQGDHQIAEVMDLTLRYILDNLGTEIRMGPLAQQAGMTNSAFSKYMVRASNMTFTKMVRQLRLSQACRLLQQSNATVASISQSVGYTNLSNFNRQFRREYGLTPREFRTSVSL
ncbi:MAG: AraC family transcriptional regulator [Actinomycetota bacterium]|nr:AraC family transcriptional regulator [Actinomycetota bacterium]